MPDYHEIHSGGNRYFQQQDMGKWGYGVSWVDMRCSNYKIFSYIFAGKQWY